MPPDAALGASPSFARVNRIGAVVLVGGLVVALGLAIWLPILSVTFGVAFLGALVAIPVVYVLGRAHPLAPLVGLGIFYGLVLRNKEGLQLEELAFAGYYFSYLVSWFGSRIFIYRESVVRTPVDLVLASFLIYVTASIGLTIVFNGDLGTALSEWISYSMFALYFPIREACDRYDAGKWVIAGIVLFLGLYAGVRNLALLKAAAASADHARAIAGGRVPMNEALLLSSSLGCFAVAASARLRRISIGLAGVGALLVGALILSQSRAFYVDLALGMLLLLLFLPRRSRFRFIWIGSLTTLLTVGAAFALFGDAVTLVGVGLLNRVLSLGTATSTDISLINRFFETRAAWEYVKANPILGYGLGVSFTFYDAIFDANWTKSYVHNGYLMLWYKFGIFGLLAVLVVWCRSIVRGFQVRFSPTASRSETTLGLWGSVVLVSLIPSHASSAAFATSDSVLAFTLVLGLVVGLYERTSRLSQSTP